MGGELQMDDIKILVTRFYDTWNAAIVMAGSHAATKTLSSAVREE